MRTISGIEQILSFSDGMPSRSLRYDKYAFAASSITSSSLLRPCRAPPYGRDTFTSAMPWVGRSRAAKLLTALCRSALIGAALAFFTAAFSVHVELASIGKLRGCHPQDIEAACFGPKPIQDGQRIRA